MTWLKWHFLVILKVRSEVSSANYLLYLCLICKPVKQFLLELYLFKKRIILSVCEIYYINLKIKNVALQNLGIFKNHFGVKKIHFVICEVQRENLFPEKRLSTQSVKDELMNNKALQGLNLYWSTTYVQV